MIEEYSNKIMDRIIDKSSKRNDFLCNLQDFSKPKFYALGMLPYPSGNAHMGHVRVYTIVDVIARYKKLKNFNVINPIGWDAFGLPAENAAIKNNVLPQAWTKQNISEMKNEQLSKLGWSFDWDKEVDSSSPEYYKWTQWIFLQFFKHDKAYRAEMMVNWCPEDQTVLADEQVNDGKCWRCDSKVEKRLMEQWFLRLSDYAAQLWDDIDKLGNWSKEALAVQKNWINKSEGANITFFEAEHDFKIEVFTTRADTLFGVSAVVLAPEHPVVQKLLNEKPNQQLSDYVYQASQKSNLDRLQSEEKTGIDTGFKAICPVTHKKIPIFVADYALADYATGAVMCVPNHDKRDYEFALKYNLELKTVIAEDLNAEIDDKLLNIKDGYLVQSGSYSGLTSEVARKEIVRGLAENGRATEIVNYNLRDWSVSRQRYWGCPIPIIHCSDCGAVPVPEDQLPVVLPENVNFSQGKANIDENHEFAKTTCPKCNKPARRELDTLDTFICSSWYAYRYLDPRNDDKIFDSKIVNHWMPIDFYVGGLEHAAQHMLYFRFFTKFFHEIGLINFDEPVDHFFTNGMVLKGGAKMSKSKGNVVLPTEAVEEYGADAVRLYIMSDTPAEQEFEWSDSGLKSKLSFIKRLYKNLGEFLESSETKFSTDINPVDFSDMGFINEVYQNIQSLESAIEFYSFNNAVGFVHKLANIISDYLRDNSSNLSENDQKIMKKVIYDFLVSISIFMPFLSEDLIDKYLIQNSSVYNQTWPNITKDLTETNNVTLTVQINGKKTALISIPKDSLEEEVKTLAAANSDVQRRLTGLEVVKAIYVKNKIYNIVAR